ncbi:type II secretion system protein [bacterium]|nr:type II secretion system protein [bacterium]
MTRRSGFTLAEVLITLGIIGVVAAMTIPNLIANTNGAKFRSQFKKSISTLNQAGLMSQAQYDFDYAGTSAACATDTAAAAKEHPEVTMTFCAILNGTLTGQTYVGAASNLKRNANGSSVNYTITKGYTGGLAGTNVSPSNYLAYTLADGSIVAFNKAAKACELPIGTQLTDTVISAGVLKDCTGFIDVNGVTLPNKEVSCGTGATNTATQKVQTPCTVKNDANHMTDVFPIVFHDATVEPASDAAKYVLTSSK